MAFDDLPSRIVTSQQITITQLQDGTALVNGVAYDFRVAAVTDVGLGLEAVLGNQTPAGTPAAPTGLTGSASSRTADLEWQAPVDTGGVPLTGSVVRYRLVDTVDWSPLQEFDSLTSAAVNKFNQPKCV